MSKRAAAAEENPYETELPTSSEERLQPLIARVDDYLQRTQQSLDDALLPHCAVDTLRSLIFSFLTCKCNPLRHPLTAFVATKVWAQGRGPIPGRFCFELDPIFLPLEAVKQWHPKLRKNVLGMWKGDGFDCHISVGLFNHMDSATQIVLGPKNSEATRFGTIIKKIETGASRGYSYKVQEWTKCDDFPHCREQLNTALGLGPDNATFGKQKEVDDLLRHLAARNGLRDFVTKLGGYRQLKKGNVSRLFQTDNCGLCDDFSRTPVLLFEHSDCGYSNDILLKVDSCARHMRPGVTVNVSVCLL